MIARTVGGLGKLGSPRAQAKRLREVQRQVDCLGMV